MDEHVVLFGFKASEVHDLKLTSKLEKFGKIGSWTLDLSTMETFWSEQTYRIHEVPFGTPTNTEMGINFYHPDDQSRITAYIQACIEEHKEFNDIFKFITAKQRQIWVRVSGYPLRNWEGKTTQLTGTFQNIDDQMKLAEQLFEKTDRLNTMVDNSPGMFYEFVLESDGSTSFPYVSSNAFELFEISEDDYNADHSIFTKLVHKNDTDMLWEKIQESAKTMCPFQWEARIVTQAEI